MDKSHKIWEEATTDMRDLLAEVSFSSLEYPTTWADKKAMTVQVK